MTIPRTSETTTDVGLLVLRIGAGLCFLLLFALKQSEGRTIFISHPGQSLPLVLLSIGALLVTAGLLTRLAAGIVGSCWVLVAYSALHAGWDWQVMPVRAILFAFLFATLAITGPGKFSIDSRFWSEIAAK
jgi:uncharacterized membrane protein YphA (DoxX/SURF4 family)